MEIRQNVSNLEAYEAKKKLSEDFFKKGVAIALFSGITYGLYSAFLTLAMAKGVWNDWYGVNTMALSAFTITYVLGSLGSAINDICSALWAILFAIKNGKFGDFLRTLNTTPGRMMILAALIGGPIASTAYVIGLQKAGSIVIPVAALCPAIGAVLGRVLFKQELNKRMVLGISICVIASFMIGLTSIGGETADGMALGIGMALIAAFGWGFEGCVAGYGTSMIDSEIGITIRQTTSGLSNLFILIPIFSILAGRIQLSGQLAFQAFTSGPAMFWFLISGFCAYISFMSWYKGNSMCGAALGMACNATYSFWGPFFCWIILGVIGGMEGWDIPLIGWIAAILMIFGILVIAMNPLDLLKKKENV